MSHRHLARMRVVGLTASLALVLSGCSGGAGSDETELRVLVSSNAQHPDEQRKWMARISRDFEKQTGAKVTFETFADPADEQAKIQTSMVSGSGPDVFLLGTTFVPVAAATGGFHELSTEDWEKVGGRDQFFGPQLRMSGPDKNHEVGVPFTMRPFGMAYNTEMFRKAGIEDPPTTWTDFVRVGERLTDADKDVYGAAVGAADGYGPWKYLWMLTRQQGGRLVSEDLNRAELDSPMVREAATFWFDWFTKYRIIDPKAASWEEPEAVSAFANGKAAMLPMVTPTIVPTLEDSAVKGKYAFAPMPTVPYGEQQRPPGGVEAGTIVSGDDFAVADYSQNKDLAFKFLRLVTGKKEQLSYSRTFGDLPVHEQAANELAAQDPRTKAFIEAERSAVPTAFTGAWGNLQIAVTGVVTKTIPGIAKGRYDEAELQRLLDKADRQVQHSIDRQQK